MNGLPRTGRVEPWLWRRLAHAGVPRAARGGDYLEVDKTRQVLFDVRDGTVVRVIHVSTGATGNTPLGTWYGLPQGRRLGLGALVPDVLPARVRDPRLPLRAGVPGLTRLRPDPDVDRLVALRRPRLRYDRLRPHVTMSTDANDPLIRQLREQLSDNDVRIVEAVNARLKLVAQLKRVKEERGIGFLDPAREEWMLQFLTRANRGPLSPEGLREIYTELLDLTKREVGRVEARGARYSSGSAANSSGETVSRNGGTRPGRDPTSGGDAGDGRDLVVGRVALELDARLLDHLVGGVDLRAGPDRERDRVGRPRVDLDLGAVLLERDPGVDTCSRASR